MKQWGFEDGWIWMSWRADGNVLLTKDEALDLADALTKWASGDAE